MAAVAEPVHTSETRKEAAPAGSCGTNAGSIEEVTCEARLALPHITFCLTQRRTPVEPLQKATDKTSLLPTSKTIIAPGQPFKNETGTKAGPIKQTTSSASELQITEKTEALNIPLVLPERPKRPLSRYVIFKSLVQKGARGQDLSPAALTAFFRSIATP